jgi:hypothetical protein
MHSKGSEILLWQKKKIEPNIITLARWVDKAFEHSLGKYYIRVLNM